MNPHANDPMVAFEQTRVADLATFYRDLAALADATTVEQVLARKQGVHTRLQDLSPALISRQEYQALEQLLQAMTDSCVAALGH
ncbi:hypothetical protein [Pseudomonas fulva]|uniref:hypothetical protein n=1 Tax=Pseudomonas fulva TaxID=47880 RepID=UPI0015E421FA|nr:hypothetical protein [Pseudomonas fulva]MBA1218180.1 hypothetical protein [Pseudomonas fulva]